MSAAENAGGWPDPTKPGTPLNPERDGWHWVEMAQAQPPKPYWWSAEHQDWAARDWLWLEAKTLLIYRGPCFLPSELTAARAKVMHETLALVEHWWLREGMHAFHGAPAAIFEVRAALEAEGKSPPDPACPNAYLLRENRRLREAVIAITRAVCRYLPPDGISAKDCISEVLAATDNPEINDIMARGAIYDR